jgi:hypothetical protein
MSLRTARRSSSLRSGGIGRGSQVRPARDAVGDHPVKWSSYVSGREAEGHLVGGIAVPFDDEVVGTVCLGPRPAPIGPRVAGWPDLDWW